MWRSSSCYLELQGSLLGRRQPLSFPGSPQAEPRKQAAQRTAQSPYQRLSPPGSFERLDPLPTLLLAVAFEAVFPLRLLDETCPG